MTQPSMDVRRLLADVAGSQGSRGLRARLELEGLPIPEKATLRKWRERKAIPGDWLVVLLILAERETGRRLDLYDYIAHG